VIAEKTPDRIFRGGVALGRRIGNPEIELKAAVSRCTNVRYPFVDRVWLHHV
jgi:hypothetical protein